MSKLLKLATLGTLVLPLSVFAASATNVSFDGETTVTGTRGEEVTATLRVLVPTGERVRWIETDIVPDGLAPVCHEVDLEEGTHFVDLELKLPTVTGSGYDLNVDMVSRADNQPIVDCEDTASGVSHDTDNFNNVIRVIAGSSSGPIGGGSDDDFAELMAKIVAALKALGISFPGTTACQTYTTQYAWLGFGMRNATVQAYQTFLMSHGQSIPAGATGYFGPQTAAAEAGFLAANHCN